jgi:hypothetical protein
MTRLAILAGIALGLAISAYAVAPVLHSHQAGSSQPVLRARWGTTPGLPPSGGYCADY